MSRIQNVLTQWLASIQRPQSDCEIIVAFSGGRDSHVLLHALCALKPNFPTLSVRAVHINHGLQALAPEWALHCERKAAALGLRCDTFCLQLNPFKGQSIEEAARQARYLAFAKILKSHHYLLTAHSEDDQAETVLLQLMRGAGPQGISAMPQSKRLGEGYHVRPLLSVSRQEIAEYALAHHLDWVEDPSNENRRFTRNFLRHEVLKPMQSAFPSVTTCIARSAAHVADMQTLLKEYLATDLLACQDNKGRLKLNVLNHFSVPRQMAVLKGWLHAQQIRSPSTRILRTILQQALTAKQDAKVSIRFGSITLFRYRQTLYVQKQTEACFTNESLLWDLSKPLSWGGHRYQAHQIAGQGLRFSNEQPAVLTVKRRQGGERCRLAGDKMTRSLKKIFQTWQVPFWQRSMIPLFYQENKLVCIGETLVSEGCQAAQSEQGWVIKIVE
ncbi:MAG: tRNA lysidine(34) synthetase TilS [Candidatus Berkiella sp.]